MSLFASAAAASHRQSHRLLNPAGRAAAAAKPLWNGSSLCLTLQQPSQLGVRSFHSQLGVVVRALNRAGFAARVDPATSPSSAAAPRDALRLEVRTPSAATAAFSNWSKSAAWAQRPAAAHRLSSMARRLALVQLVAPAAARRGLLTVSAARRGGFSFGYSDPNTGERGFSWLPSISNVVITAFLLLTTVFTFTDFILMLMYISWNQITGPNITDFETDPEAEEALWSRISPETNSPHEYAIVVGPSNEEGVDLVRKVLKDHDMDTFSLLIDIFPSGHFGDSIVGIKAAGFRPHFAVGEYTLSLFLNKLIKLYRLLSFSYDLDKVPNLIIDLRTITETQQPTVAANVLENMSLGRNLCRTILVVSKDAAELHSERDDISLGFNPKHMDKIVYMKGTHPM